MAHKKNKKKDTPTTPVPVYVVCGTDEFLKRQAVQRIVSAVLGEDSQHLALSPFDGPTAELADVLDELRTLPFLAERRLVVVRDADAFITKHRAALEHYLTEPSDWGVLLLVCRSFPANTRLAKLAARVGEVVRCEPLKGGAVQQWVAQRIRNAHGKGMEPAAIDSLINLVGEELERLDAELEKLALYVLDRPVVTVKDVEAVVGADRRQTIWAILDAIGTANVGHALELWERLLMTDRDAPYRAIGGLAWGVRQMLAGRAFGRPYRSARPPFSREQLEVMLVRLKEADLRSKTGLGSVQAQVEQFIVNCCAGERGGAALPGG